MKQLKRIISMMVFVAILSISLAPTYSSAEASQGTFKFKTLNNSTLQIDLNHAKATIQDNGTAIITDQLTGESKQLPSQSTDKNGQPVRLVYKPTDTGLTVEVHSLSNSLISESKAVTASSVGKCVAGTAGGAVTGGGTLGLAGTAVGTVTIPGIGTVGGGIVGTIAGVVGGGLTGAAASCF